VIVVSLEVVMMIQMMIIQWMNFTKKRYRTLP
jgi:hypothetical protein